MQNLHENNKARENSLAFLFLEKLNKNVIGSY